MIQFAAQLRKPLLANTGNTAQFQAASSIDSDIIITLGNSRFRQMNLLVSVYLLKDANGHDMRSLAKDETTGNIIHGNDGEYPLICRFNAVSNPPKAENRSGIFGVGFFAPLGKHADEINRLGLSCYGDSLVLVLLSESEENLSDIETNWDKHAQKLLESEQKAYIRKLSHFENANKDLFGSAFMNLPATYEIVEKEFPYLSYLQKNKKCCYASKPCHVEATELVEIPASIPNGKVHYLSFCSHHAEEVDKSLNSDSLGEVYRFAEAQERRLWVKNYLEHKFSPQGFQIPDSVKILEWAKENQLDFIQMGSFVKKAEKLMKAQK